MTQYSIISLIIILSVAVVDMATDLYSVALSVIAKYFGVKGNVAQLTISSYLVGFAVSGLIYGPLSDHYGRRPIMLIGMVIFAFGSIACCIADSITFLIVARFVQGMGAGVAGVVGYAAIKDIYSGSEYARAISKLNMVVALSPGIAPVVGSYIISEGYNWNFLFVIIFLASIITLGLIYFKLQETLVVDKNEMGIDDVISNALKQYKLIFKNYRFLGFATIHGLTFMWLWADVANYPFIFESLGVEVQYFGYIISVFVTFYVVGTIINRKFVSKIGMNRMLIIGLILPIIPESLLVCFYLIGKLNIFILIVIWIPSNIGIALIISNNVTLALESIKNTGLGSAFVSFCNLAFGAAGTYIVGRFFHYGILSNLLLTIVCSIIAIFIYSKLFPIKKEVISR